MLMRIFLFAAVIGAAYWYWSGPYQEKINPDYDSVVRENDENMSGCIRAAAYKMGATGAGVSESVAKEQCAEKYNVYESEGHWHRYDMSRPD